MKLKSLVILLVCLMSSGIYAGTIGAWNAPSDACGVVGQWSNQWMWQANAVPVPTTATNDEIKIQSPGSTVTVDDTASINYIQRLTLGSTDSANPVKVYITEPDPEYSTTFGMYEFRVGAPAGASSNCYAEVYQTGGTLNVDDLMITRCKSNYTTATTTKGTYTISGGVIQTRGTKNRLVIASYAETTGNAGTGKFIVDGTGGTINVGHLVAGGKVATGTGGAGDATIEYKLIASGAVSKITAGDVSLDQQVGTITRLLVDATTAPSLNVILLVDNTGTAAVVGKFDLMNGGSANEGASVNLGGTDYMLTYQYDTVNGLYGGNDIALLIPEPATVALLSLGLLAIRRRK